MPAVNRLLIASAAMAAFSATWFHLRQDAAARVHGRPAMSEPVALATEWREPEPIEAPAAAVSTRTVDELFTDLDADLGFEGQPVDRARIERALQSDPELRRALGLP